MFPPVETADESGFLCYGGELSPEILRSAYASGIFPWPVEGCPIFWFSPPERALLFLDEVHAGSRLRRSLRARPFEIRLNTAFDAVIGACAAPRSEEDLEDGGTGTWITPALRRAYNRLHHLGEAHSVEAWRDGELVGGLYGVSWGQYFCGESMFHRESNASKAALLWLADFLREQGCKWLDCQVMTPHFEALGARDVERDEFLGLLKPALSERPGIGWGG